MSIRDTLNNGEANRLADAWRAINMGDLINMLLANGTYTETGVTVTTNKAALANQPSSLFIANATTATTTGVKQLLKGPITGPKALVPATGQCVWDGGKNVLFAAVDAVTVAKFMYAQAADATASILQRTVGEIDSQ